MAEIVCPRCKGNGVINHPRVHLDVPGGCFKCDVTGTYETDHFKRTMDRYSRKGEYFGISYQYEGEMIKHITRGNLATIEADSMSGVKITQITEEQARKFFAKYGMIFRYKVARLCA